MKLVNCTKLGNKKLIYSQRNEMNLCKCFKLNKCWQKSNKNLPIFFRTRTVQQNARQSVIAVRHQPLPESRKEIELQLEIAFEAAKKECAAKGVSFDCMWAWEVVDELLRIYYEWNMMHPLESEDATVLTKIESYWK